MRHISPLSTEGKSWYLPYALEQARSANRRQNGNANQREGRFQETSGLNRLRQLQENSRDEDFLRRYRHRPSNGERFEVFCWLRWFSLLEYMRGRSWSVWYLDSDVLLYSGIDEIHAAYSPGLTDCGFLIPRAGIHVVRVGATMPMRVILDGNGLWRDFVISQLGPFKKESISQLYEEKWAHHVRTGSPGGICDMTTLYLFWRESAWACNQPGAGPERHSLRSSHQHINGL